MALQFPVDLEDTKYEARVSFQAIKLRAVDVAAIFGNAPTITGYGENQVDPGLARAAGVSNTRSSSRSDTIRAMNGDNADQQTIQSGEVIERRLGKCTLFLPQAVQINDAAAYDNVDLGILGAGVASGLQAGNAVVPSLMNAAVEGIDSFVDTLTGNAPLGTPVGRLAVTRAANKIPSDAARGAVRSATRTSVNPNTRALFKSVPLREFTFTFKMIPTSKTETQNIKEIVNFFRTELYPEVIKIGNINAGYEFPNVFEINMYYKNTSNRLATRILPSYLRNFTATYNSGSMGFLEGGDFTEVDISMTFVESSTLHKELIGQGY